MNSGVSVPRRQSGINTGMGDLAAAAAACRLSAAMRDRRPLVKIADVHALGFAQAGLQLDGQ